MTGQLSDFLAAHAERVADVMRRTGAEQESHDATGEHGPRQFINAVLVALTADDLRPLITYFDLGADKPPGIEQRLESALSRLAALRRATVSVAAEEMDESDRLALCESAAEEIAVVGRRLATGVSAALAGKLSAATTSSSARGTSMSITMHELRRPLTILNSYGQLLSTGMLGQLPETAMVAIEGITASTEMMVRMVNAIAEVSRLEDPDDQLNFEVISVDEIVTGAVDHVSMEAKLRDTVLETDVEGDVTIRGDRRRLTLALTNMVGNAVKHGPPGSTITVRAFGDQLGAHFLVRDHGQGFPSEDSAHLFDKYFRSVAERQRKVPGSGLGLFIVKTVAERHNGSVHARSAPGEGAEFEMIIPLHQ
jgi:two-component system phosphate regulon sensor histidine kinase PhoR